MLLIIGLALMTYGYISVKQSEKRRFNDRQAKKTSYFPEWFPQLEKLGGVLCIIIGLLLSLTYFIL